MVKYKPSVTAALAALAGSSLLLTSGCGNNVKKVTDTEAKDRGGSSATPAAPAASTDRTPPGITATEIKIGQSLPYSGPAAAYGVIGKGDVAYFKMINEQGGINGRKITLISLDDSYSPAKAMENVRRLVEEDHVAFIFNNVGAASNAAVQQYLNDKKVPQLFVASGADNWADPARYPWTMGFQPTYRIEAKVYARHLMKEKPAARLCVLYQNDEFGQGYLHGLRDGLGDRYDAVVIKAASYKVTDPTVDAQIVTLHAAGCDALLIAATPKFAAQTIRKVFDLGWKPLQMISSSSVSHVAVLGPVGLDKSKGLITAPYLKDVTDPTLADDPGLNEYRAFAGRYLTDLDPGNGSLVYAFAASMTLAKVLTQCGNDLSRENIMKQAASLTNVQLPVTVPGILLNTSATDFQPLSQVRLARFNGNNFVPFGEIEE